MPWLVEQGIGEQRALLVENGCALAAKLRWPGELTAGQSIAAKLIARRAGSPRGTALTEDGAEVLVDRLPASITEGRPLLLEITRAPLAERGRLKRAHGRYASSDQPIIANQSDPFVCGDTVRRMPAGLWEETWSAAWDREVTFAGGTLLFDTTPGMTVIDIDGELAPRELALAAVPAIARSIRAFDLAGSIAIDFPTLAAKIDRQATDAALGAALAGWPHERTAMNGFGLVQLVARLEGPSLLHRLAHRRAGAAARYLLRQAEGLAGHGAILLAAHPGVIAALEPAWLAELERRTGRTVHSAADPALALAPGHAQIVAR